MHAFHLFLPLVPLVVKIEGGDRRQGWKRAELDKQKAMGKELKLKDDLTFWLWIASNPFFLSLFFADLPRRLDHRLLLPERLGDQGGLAQRQLLAGRLLARHHGVAHPAHPQRLSARGELATQ